MSQDGVRLLPDGNDDTGFGSFIIVPVGLSREAYMKINNIATSKGMSISSYVSGVFSGIIKGEFDKKEQPK